MPPITPPKTTAIITATGVIRSQPTTNFDSRARTTAHWAIVIIPRPTNANEFGREPLLTTLTRRIPAAVASDHTNQRRRSSEVADIGGIFPARSMLQIEPISSGPPRPLWID